MANLRPSLFVLLWMICASAAGQYFPGASPLDQKLLPGLLAELKTAPPTKHRVQTLLQVASLYLYRTKPHFDSTLYFLDQAGVLAQRLKDKEGFQEQVLLRANVHFERKEFEKPKKLIALTSDTAKIKLVMRIGDYYWSPVAYRNSPQDLPLLDSALKYCEWAFNMSVLHRQPDKTQQAAERIWYISYLYTKFGKLDRAQQVFNDFLKNHGSAPGYSRAAMYMELAANARSRSDFGEAIAYCIQAQQNLTDSPYDRYRTFLQLGQMYGAVKEWEKSIDAYKSALANLSKAYTKKESDNWTIINRIIRYQNVLGRNKESDAYFRQCAQAFPREARQDSMYYFATLGENLRADKDYAQAENYLLRAIELIPPYYNTVLAEGEMYLNIIRFYVEWEKFDKAGEYVSRLRKIHRYEPTEYWSGIHLLEYKIDSAKGAFLPAMRNYLRGKHIEDSLEAKSKMAEYRNLEVKYQTEKKEAALLLREKDIQLLNQNADLLHQRVIVSEQESKLKEIELDGARLAAQKKEADLELKDQNIQFLNEQAKLQEAELAQQGVIRNIIVVFIVLVTTIAVLLFRQFKAKQNSEKLIAQKNTLLQHLVDEKNWLLKEMHHRVKNNLQTIVSLLESQSAFLKNSEALSAIQDSQHRVHAMSLIHQKLYRSDNMTTINMAEYLPELVRYLDKSFDLGRYIHFQIHVNEIYLDVSKVIPLGLIVNEAVTNAIKYAFARSLEGNIISLSLTADEHKKVSLTISDNGMGLPADFQSHRQAGLGIKLMRGLTEDIEGQFSIHSDGGVIVRIVFGADYPLSATTGVGRESQKLVQV
ncbi:tetratricopeptide repeat-containing sensor histidine kinase [Chryseolinea lacunae]|uniref:histidine kinase n=1 Tax=Chryseolinea lacunae TaxID=2801331 RepID=A0ABS1KUD6_9BACT|nr:sensor histidine kinase [Chryseolinea lacunae]MBL0743034.1 ATP-binding protein [Chryseolinea lacunae]